MHRVLWILSPLLISASLLGQSYRSIDGYFNNPQNPLWGAKGDMLSQITTPSYSDGISEVSGLDRPNARRISNYIFDQKTVIPDPLALSDYLWIFGQFIDHDIILSETNPFDPLFIEIPEDDQVFIPGQSLLMFRSEEAHGTGTSEDNPRRFTNAVTAFIDGSAIYGSDELRANWLRTFQGGKLKTSNGNLLPWNTTTGEFNDPIDRSSPFMEDATRSGQKLFIAGDVRANENPLLITMHTLFLREHNRICDELIVEHPDWDDETLYQYARKKVGAYLQNVTYNEWLPAMGVELPRYSGYRGDINPQISNVFSVAAFRLGHTLINSNVLRMESDGSEIGLGNMTLKDAFFNPLSINLAGGIEPYLVGMATQVQQDFDCRLVDDVRNFLFGSPSSGGMDLAAINITRGRERGLPDFNTIRQNIGLPSLKSFSEFTGSPDDARALEEMYGDLNKIDPWVGMLAEQHMPDALIGSTVMLIIERQFQNLRDGDRFYFESDPDLTTEEIAEIRNTSLRDIIMRNTGIEIMQENVFKAMSRENIPYGPELAKQSLSAVAFPNPTEQGFKLKIYEEGSSEITVRIFDSLGKLVSTSAHSLEEGDNFIHMDLPESSNSGFFNVLVEKAPVNYTILRVMKL